MSIKLPICYLSFLIILSTSLAVHAEELLHVVEGKPTAPEFELKDIEDNTHRLSDYRGKVVLLNFWATWCPPCRFEMPSMERAREKFEKDNIVMLAVNVGEDADTIFTFTSDYPVNFPLLMDLDSSVIKHYPVVGLPTTFVIDPKGRMVFRAIGTREWDDEQLRKRLVLLF